MNFLNSQSRIQNLVILFAVFYCISNPSFALAADDDTPFFAGRTGSPNVMIIFDNSNSMQDSPYLRDDGITPYRPDGQLWRRGVTVDNDCNNDGTADDPCILDSTPNVADNNGSIVYDQTKYITESEYVSLPGKNPPNFPGLAASSSAVTSIRNTSTACNMGMECDDRIYDSNVTWGTLTSTIMNSTYRYWRVEIKDTTNSTTQVRNLSGYDAAGYWTVYGGTIEYNPAHSYAYRLLSGSPGDVTYLGGTSQVYDRNYDWALLTSAIWSSQYSSHVIEIYAGTNAGLRRTLNWYDTTNGYWSVSTAFPVPCDSTSRYRILGVADDNKNASGGNHPDSKMYQAKLALQKFLDSSSIKTCDHVDPDTGICDDWRYLMNVGFATYMQSMIPQTTAQYYRKRAGTTTHTDAQFRYYYRYKSNSSGDFYNLDGCTGPVGAKTPVLPTSFTGWDGVVHTGVTTSYEFNRSYHVGSCDEQTIRYRITSLTCSPTDSSPNRLQITAASNTTMTGAPAGVDPAGNPQWGYSNYGWRYFADNGTGNCSTYTPPATAGGGTLVGSGEDCYTICQNISAIDTTTGTYYETTWKSVDGDLRRIDSAKPGYVKKIPDPADTYTVTPYIGYCGGSWQNCTTPNPEDTSGDNYGDWTLVPVGGLANVPLNSAGTLGNINRIIYDSSTFFNPSIIGDINRPHGWSYKRTKNNNTANIEDDANTLLADDHYMFLYSSSYISKWPDSVQKSPYFPSEAGNPLSRFSNYNGDDQTAFVDLPVVDEDADDKGDDLDGDNINKVKNLIGLSRIVHPANSSYVQTMAPISAGSLSVNTSETSGQGTPLAASLTDAYKYYQSYIAQDSFTQGGCRQNYIILLTDGLETGGGVPKTAAQALQAMTYNSEETPVKVYVVGFGLDKSSQTTLNEIAAAGGSTQAYFANNVDELVDILAHDITGDILSGSYSRSKVTLTPNTRQTEDELSLYYAYFDYPIWRGHLMAWELYSEEDARNNHLVEAGTIKRKTPYWASNCAGTINASDAGNPDAGCIIAEDYVAAGVSPDGPGTRRTLYTTASGSKITFHPDNAGTLKGLVNPNHLDINGNGTADEVQDAKDVINHVHHPGYDNGKYVGNRDTKWPLADIYSSGPVLVTPPSAGDCSDYDNNPATPDSWPNMNGYCAFKEAYKNRPSMLYVGANGGMIEAIAAGSTTSGSGGYEKWGYLPNNVLGKLYEFKDGHRFTMDLTILAGEVDTSANLAGTGWKTMLVAGQRKGGSYYTALDVTDPDDPKPMWEFTDANLGQTWSTPSFGRIVINGVKTSVVFFGGGYSPNENVGNRLFIVRASDGTVIKEFEVGSSANDIPSNLRTMRYLTNKVGTVVDYRTNLPELPDGTGVDYSTRKYFIEAAYFGDTSGTMWRLHNLNTDEAATTADPFGPPWSDNVTLTALYTPENDKKMPIYYRPVVHDIKKGSIDNGVVTGCVKRYVLAGTGDENNPTSAKDGAGKPILNYFFEIEDREFDFTENDTAHTPAWTAAEIAEGKFRLNWRLSLGLGLPHDQYGFLLDNAGARIKKSGKDILDLQTYILNWSDYNANGWYINTGNLFNSAGIKVANANEFLIKHDTGSPMNDNGLYTNPAGTTLIAVDGTYFIRDISLWFTDENGCFYDTDGTCLVDTDTYSFGNDGKLLSGSANQSGTIITALGEKVLTEPTTQAGDVFFTSYSPEGGCAMGKSYLYGFEISDCQTLGGDGALLYNKKIKGRPYVQRKDLGIGITSDVTLGGGKLYFLQSTGDGPSAPVVDDPRSDASKLLYWKQD
ncbi:MAG: PilC beta-propeller domain-containing [Desulfobulbaceae bacterium]|nr:MAG: PilC beta-propeller domain-containing [Desulfobulbaceae bacterium]